MQFSAICFISEVGTKRAAALHYDDQKLSEFVKYRITLI